MNSSERRQLSLADLSFGSGSFAHWFGWQKRPVHVHPSAPATHTLFFSRQTPSMPPSPSSTLDPKITLLTL